MRGQAPLFPTRVFHQSWPEPAARALPVWHWGPGWAADPPGALASICFFTGSRGAPKPSRDTSWGGRRLPGQGRGALSTNLQPLAL